MFANPGSTEVPLLARHDERVRFVLGLHEGSVVGAATGYALASGKPALAVLHTTAGYGNAVGAVATARENRAPLVVVVGQQDRRHLAQRPFLAGDLGGLAGEYPVWSAQPALARDVPGTVERAWHEARTRRGPAVVVVPMDDWDAPADPGANPSPRCEIAVAGVDPATLDPLVDLVDGATRPAIVVGADADSEDGWAALVCLADHLAAPVWQAPFSARAGFPQDHPRFAGHLPADRTRLRVALAPHDLVLVVGAAAFCQYPYEPGPLTEVGTRLAMIVDDPVQAHHSPVDLAVIGPIAITCRALMRLTHPGRGTGSAAGRPEDSLAGAIRGRLRGPDPDRVPDRVPSGTGRADDPVGMPRPWEVFAALAERLPPDVIVVEESPSSRPELHRWLPARRPMGFVSAAMGGLGFALPAAVGIRMARPDRPVVAVLGDGSSVYAIQGLWTAAHYGIGVLFVVLRNGRYAVMDRLAERRSSPSPWPSFPELDVATLSEGFGCRALRVGTLAEVTEILDAVTPGLAGSSSPLLLQIDVIDEAHFAP